MKVLCRNTGIKFEISDDEIAEKVLCPCCGEKFSANWDVVADDEYVAAIIRKTYAIDHGVVKMLFPKAYAEGDAKAQCMLGQFLIKEARYSLAVYWFKAARYQGYPDGIYHIAECYWNGVGVEMDLDLASILYSKAAELGHSIAGEMIKAIAASDFQLNVSAAGKDEYVEIQRRIGSEEEFVKRLCDKYGLRGAYLFWADSPFVEWGITKGASVIVGSFGSESDVPEALLDEISNTIGHSLSYSGRYVDKGIVGETKYLICYAIAPKAEISFTETKHISDALQKELDEGQEETSKPEPAWRESLSMNCPLCETPLSLSSDLTGSMVVCPKCKQSFVARGIGIMTTKERQAYIEERLMDEEANQIEDAIKWGGSVAATLTLGFKLGGRQCVAIKQGSGRDNPWRGLYLLMWFKEDIRHLEKRLRETLESAIGYKLRPTKITEKEVEYYVEKDHPCDVDPLLLAERGSINPSKKGHSKAEIVSRYLAEPFGSSALDEIHRGHYLLNGDDYEERPYTKNYLNFASYLSKKYEGRYKWGHVQLEGLPSYDVVLTITTNDGPPPPDFIRDIEKRLGRRLTMVYSSDSEFNYSVTKLN